MPYAYRYGTWNVRKCAVELSWLLPEWLIFRHALHVRNSCVTYRGLSAHGLCLDRVLSYLITDIVARLDNDVAHHAPFFRAITRP